MMRPGPSPQQEEPFWSFSGEDLLRRTGSSSKGLSHEEAALRLAERRQGQHHHGLFRKDLGLFIRQFTSPLVLLLVAAVVLAAFLGDASSTLIISTILLATGILGFWQERNAGRAVEALRSLVRIHCTVLRDGQEVDVPSDEVVRGDLIRLRAGHMVPADLVLLEANELQVNQAVITGESFPVRKEPGPVAANAELNGRTNCLWQGSNAVSGEGTALVVHTGEKTILGRLAHGIQATLPSAFENGVRHYGYFLLRITVLLTAGILILNVALHRPVMDSVLFSLALAVGMAPELLPAIMTVAMSAGAKRLFAKKVIVKKLSSIQNLGETDLLCTDKTGTLTEGMIRVVGMRNAEGCEDAVTRTLAVLNASFETGFTNPIDDALRQLDANVAGYERLGEVPYDFKRKRLSVLVRKDGNNLLITKGAVANVLDVCTSARVGDGRTMPLDMHRAALQASFEQHSLNGYRVIAVACKATLSEQAMASDEHDMEFAGFVLMEDPLKEDITDAIGVLRGLGIQTKVITGDNRYCAVHVARELGLRPGSIITGPEIAQLSPEALVARAREAEIFAETGPEQKELIIFALQKGGATVAYMGDGINDVAAIHAADVGISVNGAVDVAREAADLVLTEKSLSVLADGFREGRRTFANTLKYILINTGATFGNMFSVAAASLMLPYLPMLPVQILLTNFLSDIPYMAVSSDNVDEEQLRRPGRWDLKGVRAFMVVFGLHSSVFDILTFLVLYFVLKVGEGLFQTGWFLESVLTELFILFIIRTRKKFYRSTPGRWLLVLGVLSFIATFILIYVPSDQIMGLWPLPLRLTASILTIVLLYVVTADLLKRWYFRRYLA